MGIRLKSPDQIATKFASRASAAGADYKSGVENPRRSWADSAAASESTYAAGVQEAISRGAFGDGVRAAGDSKWKRKASDVGAQRFPQGVTAAKSDYQAGMQPYIEALSSTDLPPRGIKGSPQNMDRSRIIAERLRAIKLAR